MALHGQILVAVGEYSSSFCEKLPEAFPVHGRANARQLPDRSTKAKAKPIWNGGNASVITYLTRKYPKAIAQI